jgi:hypothetical protein
MIWPVLIGLAMTYASQSKQAAGNLAQLGIQDRLNKSNAVSTNIVNDANADAANLVRSASNDFQAAQAALSNTQRSIGNQEKMRAFGDSYAALQTNEVRVMDNMVRGKLSVQLKAASALGALRADAAARGVGGSSADILRATAALQLGSATTQLDDNQKYVQYDNLLQRQGLMRTAVNSLDFGQSIPNLDYGMNIAPLAQSPYLSGLNAPSPTTQALWGTLGSMSKDTMEEVTSALGKSIKSTYGSLFGSTAQTGDVTYDFGELGSGFFQTT